MKIIDDGRNTLCTTLMTYDLKWRLSMTFTYCTLSAHWSRLETDCTGYDRASRWIANVRPHQHQQRREGSICHCGHQCYSDHVWQQLWMEPYDEEEDWYLARQEPMHDCECALLLGNPRLHLIDNGDGSFLHIRGKLHPQCI